MNRLAGRAPCLPALHPFAAWVHNHNGLHHGFTNIKEKDPGFPPLSLHEYRSLSPRRALLYRRCRTWYGLVALRRHVGALGECCLAPTVLSQSARLSARPLPGGRLRPRPGSAVRPARPLSQGTRPSCLCWSASSSASDLELVDRLHHLSAAYPSAVPWFSAHDSPAPTYFQAQVRATPHVVFPLLFRLLMRNIMEHTAHHAIRRAALKWIVQDDRGAGARVPRR